VGRSKSDSRMNLKEAEWEEEGTWIHLAYVRTSWGGGGGAVNTEINFCGRAGEGELLE
jgi:hypothetical protein